MAVEGSVVTVVVLSVERLIIALVERLIWVVFKIGAMLVSLETVIFAAGVVLEVPISRVVVSAMVEVIPDVVVIDWLVSLEPELVEILSKVVV